MNSLTLALVISLTLSLFSNILFFWYIRRTTSRLLYISQNLNDLITLIGVYREHLKSIYEMEMFYGDENLKHLIDHTRSLYNVLDDYEDIVYLTEPISFSFEEQNEDNLNDNEETNEDEEFSEKDVLYAGTRKRNS